MFAIGDGDQRVYLAAGVTDLRKSIDGLAALVQSGVQLDPFAPAWFVFCNRDRDKIKILHWDHHGFWLFYRRLERGHFLWPPAGNAATVLVSRRALQWLLDGLSWEQATAHVAVSAQQIL
jgi:transposase